MVVKNVFDYHLKDSRDKLSHPCSRITPHSMRIPRKFCGLEKIFLHTHTSLTKVYEFKYLFIPYLKGRTYKGKKLLIFSI